MSPANAKETKLAEVGIGKNGDGREIFTLENGLRVRLRAVPAFLVDRVQAQIKIPDPPIFIEEETGREISNPTDPDYLRQVDEAQTRKIAVSMLSAVIFGVELIDDEGNPKDAPSAEEDNWESMLAYMGVDWREALLEQVPLPPNTDLNFARNACYLLYTQIGNDDISYIVSKTLGGGMAYAEAVDTFPGRTTRSTNRPIRPKRGK